ncbi:FAD-dependent oxidoreductase [Skermania piniformis]|uniref:FAD-binding domain-containing protein n=1 Tax=Skermania pinensis TaxID=39122 RepID=A0ABX8SGD2_9ACTN|nr:hypothetical protein [Skermania piniformis]QXQ15495.1 hypothetical protein KV203_09485 [Skermania piniformis]
MEPIGLTELPDAVRAVFDDGSTVEAGVLVGADGLHSTTRTLIDPTAPGPSIWGC